MNAIVPTSSNALMPTSMDSAFQLAEMMAKWKTAPAHLHNSPGDCLMIVEQAMRWGMSPFAVAQCTSVIQGKLMFEGKLVAAALNASGILASRLEYDFSGDGTQRAVKVRGTLRGETKPREVTVFLQDAKTSNTLWAKQPDQQLVYAGTRVWARRHAPEVMLGVYAPEEFDRAEPFTGQTIDAAPEPPALPPSPPQRAADASTTRGEHVAEPPKRTIRQFLDGLRLAVADAKRAPDAAEQMDRVLCSDEVMQARDKLKNGALAELTNIISDGLRAVTPIENDPQNAADPDAADEPELPPVEIKGERYVGAG